MLIRSGIVLDGLMCHYSCRSPIRIARRLCRPASRELKSWLKLVTASLPERLPSSKLQSSLQDEGASVSKAAIFSRNLAALEAFMQLHGRLPMRTDTKESKLCLWLVAQPVRLQNGSMAEHEELALDRTMPGWRISKELCLYASKVKLVTRCDVCAS